MEDAVFDKDAVLKDDILIDALSTLVDADDVIFDRDVIFEERFHPTPSDFYLPESLLEWTEFSSDVEWDEF